MTMTKKENMENAQSTGHSSNLKDNNNINNSITLKSDYLIDAQERGLINQCTNIKELDNALSSGSCVGYIGFDATADSLHVGNLLQIMRLRSLQRFGHKPIVVVGGGTTMVGDPSGKDETRKILTEESINNNINAQLKILRKFIKFGDNPTDAILINNASWLKQLNYINFLRDFGKHFSINRMLTFDSVRLRLEREQNLSFLEFNYMILQAYDFYELNKRYNCILQMGGSDQWGNIVNGVELTRRVSGKTVYGLTCDLITTATGAKMGKTANGAVWLSEEKLSSFDYWQFWRNTHDEDVIRFMKLFTDIPTKQIKEYELKFKDMNAAEINQLKIELANYTTTLCHGSKAAEKAEEAARQLFSGNAGASLDDNNALNNIPAKTVNEDDSKKFAQEGLNGVELLLIAGFVKSKGEARRLIKGNGAKINNQLITDSEKLYGSNDLIGDDSCSLKISAGKKRHVLLKFKQPDE